MPYIKQEPRHYLDSIICRFGDLNPGEIAYVITKLLLKLIGKTPHYALYATAFGILETVKMEFYRREVGGYEDEKIQQNGDVYGDRDRGTGSGERGNS